MKYLFQILVLALALLIWQAFSGDLVPSVKEVVSAFFELAKSGKLLLGVTDSLIRYAIGLAIGSLVAVLVGLIFGLFQNLQTHLSRLSDFCVLFRRLLGYL
ncbi:hypothetical protein VBZ67_03555 [Campylobacter concisus]